MPGLCKTDNGTKIDELLQAGASRHKRVRQDVERIQVLENGRILAREARNWEIEGQKRRITRKEIQKIVAQKGLWNLAREKMYETEVHCQRKKTLSESTRPCMTNIS